jgi:carbon monoxide dehydrogenase subunit G
LVERNRRETLTSVVPRHSRRGGVDVTAKLQGKDEIIIDAPLERVWRLIGDSTELVNWGPPVRKVEVLGPSGRAEGLNSRRRVDADFDGKAGFFVERRTDHVDGRRIEYLIEEESFGIFRVMSEPGFAMEIEEAGPGRTRVVWSFFHNTKGVLGALLNPFVILRQQRRNRLAALQALKSYAEGGKPKAKQNHQFRFS